jgi:hypothetical protein
METSDTLSQAPDLSPDTAIDAFAALLDPPEVKKPEKATQAEEPAATLEPEPNTQEEGDDAPVEEEKFTIPMDGKMLELTAAQIVEAYKGQMRQADYTKKTMASAEAVKAAEAEVAKTRAERDLYNVNLQKMGAQLEGAIAEQNQIDWNALLQSDPLEFMKQKHLFDQRQAALHQTRQEQARIAQQLDYEQSKSIEDHLRSEHQALLDKLPDWKNDAKGKAEAGKISQYLVETFGYKPEDVFAQRDQNGRIVKPGITDHRAIIMARESMLYREMMAKAKQAAQAVEKLPQKTLKPGIGEKPNTDGRSAAMRQLSKTGSLEAAAATGVFG